MLLRLGVTLYASKLLSSSVKNSWSKPAVVKMTTTGIERIDEYWGKKWATNETGWHKTCINPFLEKHYDDVTQGKPVKMLFPLCGKALDMKWMADKGHTIVGIEGIAKACQEFFQESGLDYTEEKDIEGWKGSVFKSKDEKIKLYCGDVFDFTSSLEGGFTAVWDRGSYVAIYKEDRDRYKTLINQEGLLDPKCRYYLESFQYDPALHPGPPNYIPEEEILSHFCNFSATKLDEREYNEGVFLSKGIKCVIEFRRLLLK